MESTENHGPEPRDQEPPEQTDATILAELVEKIHQEFPDLQFSEARLEKEGLDNFVVVLDEEWVFRFPRIEKYVKLFSREVQLLKIIKDKVPVAVPDYEYLSKENEFGGYRMIKGGELTYEIFKNLPKDVKEKIAQQLGEFLSALHNLPSEAITDNHIWRTPVFFEKRYYTNRRTIFAENTTPDLLKRIDDFYEKFKKIEFPSNRVIHADLSSRHMLISPEKTSISGIIDFGEMSFADPADDFYGFWSYGEDFLKEVLQHYTPEKDDDLIDRSHLYFVRYLVDRLYRKYDWGQDPKEAEHLLEEHLSKIGC